MPSRALAIGAHPDDIEFGCGATLARWAQRGGCSVHHLVLTDGSKGTWDAQADPATLVTTRQDECRAAAAVIDGRPGASLDGDRVLFLGEVDGELRNDDPQRRSVVAHLRRLRPDVVLAHDPWRRYRLHPDHRAAGYPGHRRRRRCPRPTLLPRHRPSAHRPDPDPAVGSRRAQPRRGRHGFEAVKVEALLCHRSQLESTMGIAPGQSEEDRRAATAAFADRVRRQLADHGSLAGLPVGEAFHLIDRV